VQPIEPLSRQNFEGLIVQGLLMIIKNRFWHPIIGLKSWQTILGLPITKWVEEKTCDQKCSRGSRFLVNLFTKDKENFHTKRLCVTRAG
jgi:hypothetical protein